MRYNPAVTRRLLLPAFLLGLLSGPSLGADAPAGGARVTLTVWRHHHPSETAAFKELIKRFEAEHPKVRVEFLSFPYGVFTTKLAAALSTGEGPDIINIHNSWAYNYIKSGVVLALPEGEFPRARLRREFFPLLDSFRRDGAYYGLPIGASNLALYYNKDMFRKAGLDPDRPPRTWREFERAAEKMTRRDRAGRILQTGAMLGIPDGQGWNFFVEGALRQFGARIVSKDLKRVLWDGPEGVAALRWYTGFIKTRNIYSHLLPHDYDCFRLGLGAMMINGGWQVGTLKRDAPDIDYGTAPLPVGEKGIRATYGTYWASCVTRTASEEERPWAWRFLKFITSYESMKLWSERTGELPMRRRVLSDQAFKKANPMLRAFIEQLPYSYASVKKDEAAYSGAITRAMEEIIYNDMDPAEALREAAATVNKMLEAR